MQASAPVLPSVSPAHASGVRGAVRRHGLLLAIVVLGAVLRFADLGTIRIGYDDSYPMFEALRGLAGSGWSLLGQPSSVFLPNPPLMNFIQAVPLAVWRSPWAVAIFIVTLNTFAIVCVYRAARGVLSQTAAYIAATLFAINPWIIFFSRMTWVQSLVPLLVALIACTLWPLLANERRSGWNLLLAGLALTALTQTYIQAWGLLISIGLLLIVLRASIPRRPFWISLGIFAMATGVYIIGLLTTWEATQARLADFTSSGSLRVTTEGIAHAVRLVTGLDFHAQYRQIIPAFSALPAASQVVYAVLGLALVWGVVLAVRAVVRRRRDWRTGIILLVWFFVPVLLMTITTHPVHVHYLLLSVPAGSVLAAWGPSLVAQRPAGRLIIAGILIGSLVVFGLNLVSASADVGQHPTSATWDGWTLEAGAQVGDTIRQLMADTPVPWRVAVSARASMIGAFSGEYVQTLNGLNYPNFVVLPGKEAMLYLLFNQPMDPGVWGPHSEKLDEKILHFVDSAQATLVRVQPYDRVSALALPEVQVDWPSAAGLTLLGYALPSSIDPGQPIELVTYWRVDAVLPESVEWYLGAAYRALDGRGQLLAQVDGHGQWARRWREGDVYVERVRLELPADLEAGEYDLTVGLFDSIHQQAYEFVSPQGAQAAYTIPLTIAAP